MATARATKGSTLPQRESPLKAADTSYTERAARRVGHAHLTRREKARYQRRWHIFVALPVALRALQSEPRTRPATDVAGPCR